MNEELQKYYKKTLEYIYFGNSFKFDVSQNLFSSYNIDRGTQRLLRTLAQGDLDINFEKILDLGCGYGPIGVVLGLHNQSKSVQMVDVDALALEFAKSNADKNKLTNYKVYASIDYNSVTDKDFSLIVSNIPAKIGDRAIKNILLNANDYLKKNGLVAVVVVDEIFDQVQNILTDPAIEILEHKSWPGHQVLIYSFNTSVEKNIKKSSINNYFRKKFDYKIGKRKLKIQSAFGISEFDTPSFDTQALLASTKLFSGKIEKIAFLNCNIGYFPVYISLTKKISQISIVDNNLLALKISEINLKNNNFINEIILQHSYTIDFQNKVDAICGIIDSKVSKEVLVEQIELMSSSLNRNGILLLVSKAKVIKNIENLSRKDRNLHIVKTFKQKGRKVICLKHI